MKFNDTTNKSGLIQDCEFWTKMGDGGISGSSLLLARFTALLNASYARRLGTLQLQSPRGGAEDTNYSSQQFSYFAIVSGQNDYQFLTDQDGNTITDITGVLIQASGSSDYTTLKRLTLTGHDAELVMWPNASMTGAPTGYIEKNNTVFFDKLPDYSAAEGGKVFYRLVPSFFTTADTVKEPGFASPFHRLLSMDASHDWLLVNQPDATALITRLESAIASMDADLDTYTHQKNPAATRIEPRVETSR